MSRNHLSVIFASVLTLAFFCGCSTVREARKVQRDEVPRQPGEYTVRAVDAGLVEGRELSLSELESIALRYNPSILQAQLSVEQARLSLANAKSEYFPTLGASAGHNRSTHNQDPHNQRTNMTGSYSGSLSFSITLYDFGRTSAAVRAAQQSLYAAQQTYLAKCNQVVYNVRKAYFELNRADGLHNVAVEAVGQYKDHLDQVKVKKDIGESIAYDVLKAEVDFQNARLSEISSSNNVQTGWADLNLALGLAENPEYTLGGNQIHEYTESAEELLERACSNEPSLAALRFEVEVASANLDAQIAELYPNLKISLGASASGRDPGFPWLWGLSTGLSFSQNIFNAGRNRNAIRQAMFRLQAARSSYEASKQSVYRNLRVAVLNAQRAKASLEVAELAAQSAARNLEIINEKFKYGKATSVDRTDAQVSYSSAKAQAVNARFDFLEAQAAIAILIGE